MDRWGESYELFCILQPLVGLLHALLLSWSYLNGHGASLLGQGTQRITIGDRFVGNCV